MKKIRKGQVWNCGDWGVAQVTRIDAPSSCKNPGVELTVLVGSSANHTRRGDKLGLKRIDFENGTYSLSV